ncbi:MAG: hypothetical protein ACPGRE_09740 [Flavobacteriaceae bacterium]
MKKLLMLFVVFGMTTFGYSQGIKDSLNQSITELIDVVVLNEIYVNENLDEIESLLSTVKELKELSVDQVWQNQLNMTEKRLFDIKQGNDPKTSARKIYKIELTLNNQIKRFTSRISNGESIKDYLIDLPVE